jgi:hypothetical protein
MRRACWVWNREGLIFKAAALRLSDTDFNDPTIVGLADENRGAGTDNFIVDSIVGGWQYALER